MGSFIESSGTGISSALDYFGNKENIAAQNKARRDDLWSKIPAGTAIEEGTKGALATNKPYSDTAPQSLATMLSAIYGGPQTYTDANGLTQTAQYTPQESEGYKYTKQRTLEDLGRQLRMMGRGSGTVAANAYGRTLGDLNAANEQQQFGRLAGLANMGESAMADKGNILQTRAANISNLFTGLGQSQAAADRQVGLANKQFWHDQAEWNYKGAQAAGKGLNEYFKMKSGGMGGGMGGGGGA